ncbi:MAG: TatD family hydrolase [Spirochaetes bacterium]|nr:TatD family hydrolase [Spirochaetota bacterium]
MYIDSHAHFDLILEDSPIDENALMKHLGENSISRVVQASIDMASSRWSRDFAVRRSSNGMVFTVGIHPSSPAPVAELEELEKLAVSILNGPDAKLLFGIGECGLDFYRMRRPKEEQERSFRFQIGLANRLGMPLIVHSRDAMEETLAILRESCRTGGVIHCFSGDRDSARQCMDLGFYISFAGNVTYRAAVNLHDAAAYVPLDRLLVETDAPFLTPVPLRGKQNRPDYIIHTYRFIAELRGEPVESIAEAAQKNVTELLNHEAKKVQI